MFARYKRTFYFTSFPVATSIAVNTTPEALKKIILKYENRKLFLFAFLNGI